MTDTFDLTGKTAIVTGGNGGIGLGFARAIAQAGANVCIWGTNDDKNAQALDTLRQISGDASALKCDISREDDVERATDIVVERYGRLDGCFANAGIAPRNTRPFFEHSTDDWFDVINVNLHGTFFTLRAASRQMAQQPEGGALILTSSGTAIQGSPKGQAYAAAKGGLISMMYGLATDLARYNISANAIIPGWIETDMTQELFGKQRFADAVLSRIPMKRWGKPEDFGLIATYLMSDRSRWHTGDVFKIDGGFSIF